jgi:tetratricopeptide (TPR) repeat protein
MPVRPAAVPPPAPGPRPGPAPPLARDPWAWLALAGVVPLVLHCLGAPLGEPVADDFDFLHRALLEPTRSLLDGGGSLAFWRPLSHQLYYLGLGRLMLTAPGAVAGLHVLLLALATLLLYRAVRRSFPGSLAAAVALFPLWADSTRTHVAWPSEFVDLGLFFFSVAALHEATRRRLPTALVALAAALACKEMAVITAAALPFVPGLASPGERPRGRSRVRWALACGALVAAWAGAYLWVRHRAGLALPHHIETDPSVLATPLASRLWWALRGNLRAILSLDEIAGSRDRIALVALAGLALACLLVLALRRGRPRHRLRRAWAAWGLAWFAVSTAALVSIFPLWQPDRSQYASVGLGIAVAGLLGALEPWLATAVLALRLALFAACPGPPPAVSTLPPEAGSFMDFPRLARLQRLMRDIRTTLRTRYPALPHGAVVVQQNLPHAVEWAFGGDHALRVWYRDPSLSWARFETFRADPSRPVATIVEFQPGLVPAVALVDPEAMRTQLDGYRLLQAGRWAESLVELARAESLQRDPNARIFRAFCASRRALALDRLGRRVEALAEAQRGVRLSPSDANARFIRALVLAGGESANEAIAELDTLLLTTPDDADALSLRARLLRSSPR